MAAGGAARRHRWRAAVVVLVVLAVVALAAVLAAPRVDSAARTRAQALVAEQVRANADLSTTPSVSIRGRWFLPQLVRGRYSEVDVTSRDLTSDHLRLARIDSRLTDVRLPFTDVVHRRVRRIVVGRSVERASLTYGDLNAYLRASGRSVRLAPAAHGQVRLTGSTSVLGRRLALSGDVTLSVADGRLRARPRSLDVGSSLLDRLTRRLLDTSALRDRLTTTVPLQALPFGHVLTGVDARSSGLLVTATGRDVVLSG